MRLEISKKEKFIFYARYLLLKTVFIWWEVRRPKLRMFLYEVYYSVLKLRVYFSLAPSPFAADYVETRFGRFKIRPRTTDMSTVSPAFERRDIDYLIGLLNQKRSEGKRILIVDIGANVGTFSVTAGNALKGYDRYRVVGFEPAPPSLALFKENLTLNGLDAVAEASGLMVAEQVAGDVEFRYSPAASGASGLRFEAGESGYLTCRVATTTLDAHLLKQARGYDVVVIKLDVEGAEIDVMRGATELLECGPEFYLLVEDFLVLHDDPYSIIDHLHKIGARLLCKLTPYNSWWRFLKSSRPGN